ncbi:MAG: hypothetical protein JST90_00500 [Bacteroidetes bacterium]|nr:hypothetical protein [Bacteroidota bacterium]
MSTKTTQKKYCNQPPAVNTKHEEGITENRLGFILSVNKKWVNGTTIKYLFIKGEGNKTQYDVVRKAFKQWKDLGIGLSFIEVTDIDEAMVRIGFDHKDGSWSYVGRDILTISKADRTMNFGWDLNNAYGLTTALHEIGHTLGFQHEHQNFNAGIVWNTEAVYKSFSAPPNNWSKAQIDSNIISKLPPNQMQASKWDAESIMEYEFEPGLVRSPKPYDTAGIYPGGSLSPQDIGAVRSFYPPLKKNDTQTLAYMQSAVLTAKSGKQNDFVFKAPSTRKYTIQTFGDADTLMVVSEKGAKENHYLSGDDDSGFSKNTKVTLPLVKGREYLINVRVMYNGARSGSGIVVS